jgi:hypothetical protein
MTFFWFMTLFSLVGDYSLIIETCCHYLTRRWEQCVLDSSGNHLTNCPEVEGNRIIQTLSNHLISNYHEEWNRMFSASIFQFIRWHISEKHRLSENYLCEFHSLQSFMNTSKNLVIYSVHRIYFTHREDKLDCTPLVSVMTCKTVASYRYASSRNTERRFEEKLLKRMCQTKSK